MVNLTRLSIMFYFHTDSLALYKQTKEDLSIPLFHNTVHILSMFYTGGATEYYG
jgi:hypothetical protein